MKPIIRYVFFWGGVFLFLSSPALSSSPDQEEDPYREPYIPSQACIGGVHANRGAVDIFYQNPWGHTSDEKDGETGPRYLTNRSGRWSFEAVTFLAPELFRTSLALDRQGAPNSLYVHQPDVNADAYNVNYAKKKSAGSWDHPSSLQLKEEALNTWTTQSLAFDSKNIPHNSYLPGIGKYLVYGNASTGTWKYESVTAVPPERETDPTGPLFGPPTLALSTGDNAHLVYDRDDFDPDVPGRHLVYANNVPGSWGERQIFVRACDGYQCLDSLAIDCYSYVHIVYNSTGPGKALTYTTNISGGVWLNPGEPVDTNASIDSNGDTIALDLLKSEPHLAYIKSDNDGINCSYQHAYRSSETNTWVITNLKTFSCAELSRHGLPRIAVDGRGKPHIAAPHATKTPGPADSVLYFTNSSGTWRSKVIPVPNAKYNVGYDTLSIAINGVRGRNSY